MPFKKVVDDCFYEVLLSILEQTHCACMWFYMRDLLVFNIHWSGVLMRWHGWCHMKLLPSQCILRMLYNHAPCHSMQSHIRHVHACLAVTCHLHFWQNDRGLLDAPAVTRGWNRYSNKSQHRKLTLEKKILPPLLQDLNLRPFDRESSKKSTESSLVSFHACMHMFRSLFSAS